MKKGIRICLLLCMVFCICACQKQGGKVDAVPGSSGYKIYCLDNEESELVSVDYFTTEKEPKKLIYELLLKMEENPEDIKYKTAKPELIKVERINLKEDGKLTLYFSNEYTQVTGVSEVLLRAAVVKTLCQIPEVDYVEFYIANQPLMGAAGKQIGYMRGSSFIDNTGDETNFYQYADLNLYFASPKGDSLMVVPISVQYNGSIALEQLVLEQLIAGVEKISGADISSIKAVVNPKTRINKISVTDGICYLDLSEEFLTPPEGITSEVAVYSVVNSLVELPNVDKVDIMINGEVVDQYKDGFALNLDFERNLDIVSN